MSHPHFVFRIDQPDFPPRMLGGHDSDILQLPMRRYGMNYIQFLSPPLFNI